MFKSSYLLNIELIIYWMEQKLL